MWVKALKTELILNNIQNFSTYFRGNILHVLYKRQPVNAGQGGEPEDAHKYTMWAESRFLSVSKQIVHIEPLGFTRSSECCRVK
jgi:hypothetical protein